jgi:hypothetical protein
VVCDCQDQRLREEHEGHLIVLNLRSCFTALQVAKNPRDRSLGSGQPRRLSLLGLVHWREDKGMVVTAYAAIAGDLADVVDRIRVDQCPS